MESISKYNIHGIDYVKVSELNDLIRDMKRKAQAGTEPGYIEPDEGKRMSAMLALNHLGAVLNKEQTEVKMHERLEVTRKVLEEAGEKPGSWMVYKPGDKPKEFWNFVEWRHGKPIIGQTDGMIFAYEGMAQYVAEKLGDGWKVIDVSPEACYKAEKLLAAIFREDDEDDESWADGIGQAFRPD
jgi:hypothetical protein